MKTRLSYKRISTVYLLIAIILAIMPITVMAQAEDNDTPPNVSASTVDSPYSPNQESDSESFSTHRLLDPENIEYIQGNTLLPLPNIAPDPNKNLEQSTFRNQPQPKTDRARADNSEPLIACSDHGNLNWTTTSGSPQVIKECTLSIPNDGWVFMSSNASVAMIDEPYEAAFKFGIDSTNAVGGIDRIVDIYSNADDGTDRVVALSFRTQVTAGSHTFYFLGRRTSGTGTVLLYDPTLSVIFLSDSSSPLLSCGEADDVDWSSTSDTFGIIRRCSLTIPEQGHVFITGGGWVSLLNEPYMIHLRIGIDSTAGLPAADRGQGVPGDSAQDDGSISVSILQSISPGTHDFYLLGRRFSGTGTVELLDSTLSVLYIPDSASGLKTCGYADDDADWQSELSTYDIIRQCNFTMPTDGWAYVVANGLNPPGDYELAFRIGIDEPNGSDQFSRWINGLTQDTTASVSALQWIPAGQHTAYLAGARFYGSEPAAFYDSTLSVITSFTDQTCYRLTRTHSGNGSNPTASPTNSSGCNTGEYNAGASISLTASPASGWKVDSWSGTDNDSSNSTSNSVTIPASDHTITVNYRADCYRLTRAHTGNGTNPTASPSNSTGCSANEYIAGQNIILTASPANGWEVGSWSGTNNDNNTSNSNSLTMPATDHTVRVNYIESASPFVFLPIAQKKDPPAPFPEISNGYFDSPGDTSWDENSINGLTLIVSEEYVSGIVGTPFNAHSSPNLTWLGGRANERSILTQDVTLPTAYQNVKLSFYYWTESSESSCTEDRGYVKINNNTILPIDLCGISATRAWRHQTVNLGGYVGQTVTLHFMAETDSDGSISHLFVDDVKLCDGSSAHPCP